MSGLLVVLGDVEAQRAAFAQGRALWAAALPLVLEKHGIMDFSVVPPKAVSNDLLHSHDCVVVAGVADDADTDRAVELILAAGRPVLVDGRVPGRVRDLFAPTKIKPAKPEMTVTVTDTELVQAARCYGADPGGRILPSGSKSIDRDSRLDWEAIAGVPIDSNQAAVWRACGWDADCWLGLDEQSIVLAEWQRAAAGERFPAVVQRGNALACAIGLMAFLGQAHTSEPTLGGEWRSSPRTFGLEILFLALIDRLFALAGAPRRRLMPWPDGYDWVRSVRHDFDRPLPASAVAEVLAQHKAAGSASTWYWRARHLKAHAWRRVLRPAEGNRAVKLVAAEPTAEVALHTELLWTSAKTERAQIERVIGRRVEGTSAHGDPNCFRYQGAPNVLWAEREGMLYTELIQQAHLHPHRFAGLATSGEIKPLDVICLPHHESLDRSTTDGDALSENILRAADLYRDAGGMLQVMNHPDVNRRELFQVLRDLPADGRLDWTAKQAATWWRATHVDGADAELGDYAGRIETLEPDGRRFYTSSSGARLPAAA